MLTKNKWFGVLNLVLSFLIFSIISGCGMLCINKCQYKDGTRIEPDYVTEKVAYDSDDPAIWINKNDPSKSLILGTDKKRDGGIYVFDLKGKIVADKVIKNVQRPNNIDIEYGFKLGEETIDIAVYTERYINKIRVISVPDMKFIDNGGIPVFEDSEQKDPMGIALYKRTSDGEIFAIVSRKEGPTENVYLYEYYLVDNGEGTVTGELVRKFGNWSGTAEIEAICVDDDMGFVYYSDENTGIRKYYADPDHPQTDKELAIFGKDGFAKDREGISIYKTGEGTGYILVSDQQANTFNVYKREGDTAGPHSHTQIAAVSVSTNESDGSDATHFYLGQAYPRGLFVAMSDNKTFQIYSWDKIQAEIDRQQEK